MRKIIEFFTIAVMGIGYLLTLLQWKSGELFNISFAFFVEHLIRVILSICGFIFVCNNLKTKFNNKANFMAISILATCILLVMQIWYYMQNETVLLSVKFLECNWLIEILQIATLFVCVHYIDEHSNILKWAAVTFFLVIIITVLVSIHMPIDSVIKSKEVRKVITETAGLLCIAGIIGIYHMDHKKIQLMPVLEQKCIYTLLIIKTVICMGFILNCQIKFLGIYFLVIILQIAFNIVSVIYINELIISINWKKIDLGVKDKNEQLLKGYIEQKTLTAAAREINGDIKIINEEALNLELKLKQENKDKSTKYIGKIKNNCERLLKLSHNILDLNIYESENRCPDFEYTNLSQLAGSVIESLETYVAQRGIQISYNVSGQKIMAEVEKEGIERLLINLISNAVKYNKENGYIEVILAERKKRIYLCVKDTGIGISSAYQKLIFEKFQRVNSDLTREQEGSGLGLSIVKSLVDVHHGEIKIVSKEGRGTVISITFPKFQPKSDYQNKTEQENKKPLSKKMDDEISGLGTCKTGGR